MFGAKLDRIGRVTSKIKQRAAVLLIGPCRFRADPLEIKNFTFKIDLICRPGLLEDLHDLPAIFDNDTDSVPFGPGNPMKSHSKSNAL